MSDLFEFCRDDPKRAADALEAKDAEIERLTAERQSALLTVSYWIDQFAEVKADNDRLRAALKKYGLHREGCGFTFCHCGLSEVLQHKDPDPCASGHDFVDMGTGGTAKCKDCGELADCAETGAARHARSEHKDPDAQENEE